MSLMFIEIHTDSRGIGEIVEGGWYLVSEAIGTLGGALQTLEDMSQKLTAELEPLMEQSHAGPHPVNS